MKERNKAFMSIRVPTQRWIDQNLLDELLGMLDANRTMVDELALFTGFTHSPPTLEKMLEVAAYAKIRIPDIKARGYGCGINVLTTMGHHNENLPHSFNGNYTRRTDLDGTVCEGCFCPNDDRFVADYVIPVYAAMAQAEPDFIWIDDDVRSGHGPLKEDCFCDKCLALFNNYCGENFNRDSIRKAFISGSADDKLNLRLLWLQFKRDTINSLMETIEKTVHGINPDIIIGFMTGERYDDGYDFDTNAKTLAGEKGCEVMWRPGGGFYRDTSLKEMVDKAHDIGRQVAGLPQSVANIQSEIENFNYEALGKSVHVNVVETAAYIAAGSMGAAYNIMNMYEDIALEKGKLFETLSEKRPFYDAMVKALQRKPTLGIYTGWNKNSEAAGALMDEESVWPRNAHLPQNYANQMFEIGLPVAYCADNADIIFLRGTAPYTFTGKQLLYWLSKGVYADGPALEALNDLGYGEYTGIKVKEYHTVDCIEILENHTLNGKQSGRMRDCRQSFWKCPCASLVLTDKNAEILAKAVDYNDDIKADWCMGLFENKLGGRVCVSGYYPWDFVLGSHKAAQIKEVMLWLSKGGLPAYVSSLHKVNLWVRKNNEGNPVLAILSQSLDIARGLTLKIKTESDTLVVTDMAMNKTKVISSGMNNGYAEFVMPELPAWSLYFAVVE